MPAITGDPWGAYASHEARAHDIAAHYARSHPLDPWAEQPNSDDPHATEDVSFQWIAHLQDISQDPARNPMTDPDLLLFRTRLGERRYGDVGTNGDYDMALKGLVTILYRYRKLLTEADIDRIFDKLIPPDIRGAHPKDVEIHRVAKDIAEFEALVGDDSTLAELLSTFLPFGLGSTLTLDVLVKAGFWVADAIYYPETENHLLMIESSRYLINQLLFDGIAGGEQKGNLAYKNSGEGGNGLAEWLLEYMQVIAQHDFREFNARPYSRLSIHALLNLYDFAQDREVRTAAQILLDYVMVKFALSSNRQRRVSPFRRLQQQINHPSSENELLREAVGSDPAIGLFSVYTGPVDRAGGPGHEFPEGLAQCALISGLSSYRPPPAAYVLSMTQYPAVQHRFSHGVRPRARGSPDTADGGVEIYYRSPSFLLTAGGMFLNSGMGHDEWPLGANHPRWKDIARAQATTLIPTRALDVPGEPCRDVMFADLIRFDPWPDSWSRPSEDNLIKGRASTTAVHRGFACGAHLQVPDMWLQLTGAAWEDGWLFLDLNADLKHYGPLGLYVAVYRTPVANPEVLDEVPDNLGLLYAAEADTMDFAAFEQRTREGNSSLPAKFKYGESAVFHTPDGHRLGFWLQPTNLPEQGWVRVADLDETPADIDALPLVDGPYLRSPGGHDGLLEIRQPGGEDRPLILDFRNKENPVYRDNIGSLPQPWLDRSQALYEYAQTLRPTKPELAAQAMVDRVRISERLAQADPAAWRPALALALYDIFGNAFQSALDLQATTALAQQAVTVNEGLAGLTDYQNLTQYTPNQYWEWPYLSAALYYQAVTIRPDQPQQAAQAMANRVRLFERLAQADPAAWRPALALALYDIFGNAFQSALDLQATTALAQQAVTVDEELAGLTEYQNLTQYTPNQYWEWPYLSAALYYQAVTIRP
ncbi:hypothetical protein, partial [Streptomyces sp. NPDC002676]